jgi:hypothetical protein
MKIFFIALLSLTTLVSVSGFAPLSGVKVQSVKDDGGLVDLGEYLKTEEDKEGKSLMIFGTYAGDFNNIEYGQRLRYYLPKLKEECGITKVGFVMNCRKDQALTIAEMVDLDTESIDLFIDNKGEAGRVWGVERGWEPDNRELSPYLKLFLMLWGLGAWATLPAVIGGYIGNPLVPQPWIEDAFGVNKEKGRWPDQVLEVGADGSVVNKFTELPVVGTWPRRPLELATLRLQNMIGISIQNWGKLGPDEEALDAGVLTQLGGCLVLDNKSGETLFKWRDPGICAVANFEDLIKDVKAASSK